MIVGERFDLAILSGPMALHRARRFWWSGAIAGVYRLRVILFAVPCGFCPICFGSPNYRAVRHRGIGIAQPSSGVCRSACPAFFPSPQGSMTGAVLYDPVKVATAQGIPVGQYPPARSPL
ncbi:MAG: hypothetical protein GDA36_08785 [Rhodobacteraceae bacterium]|nr:hypothetical protein [Paracoccaceae bacterium]